MPRDNSVAFLLDWSCPVRRESGLRGGRRPRAFSREATSVSIVRIGLAETKKFSEGYDAIFGKKQAPKAGKKPVGKKKKPRKK